MSIFEIIIAGLVLVAVVGQYWLVTSARRRIDRQIRGAKAAAAKQKAQLIETDYEKQTKGK